MESVRVQARAPLKAATVNNSQGVEVDAAEHELRISVLERDRDDFKEVAVEIRNSLQALVRLEERHNETSKALGRAFDALEKQDKRINDIELFMPGLKEMRALIVGGVCLVLSTVGAAVIALVVMK